ncbi:tRNA (adenosine(37)-N6)-threonylcarbamoyltransferase complex ATPase subunit type 1 TsaE [Liquorilactobacillus ghanensis]|uniref:tRNA (adenosine(37)-N6)-threonylcarbamoyltransferase complex ATPase subunit type 1 TsaE n=1 Tax=Liquorilactobacillus ghanensis TaxID=399370 RepID=UPI0039E9022B
MLTIRSTGPDQTQSVAKKLAALLQPNDLILLIGDLGSGKTTFTQGLAAGLQIDHHVKSPTFNIVNEYHQGRLPLFHLDVYRLEKTGGADMGLEEYFNGGGVSVVEWPKFIAHELPAEFLQIELQKGEAINDDEQRKLVLTAKGDRYQQLLSDLAIKLKE